MPLFFSASYHPGFGSVVILRRLLFKCFSVNKPSLSVSSARPTDLPGDRGVHVRPQELEERRWEDQVFWNAIPLKPSIWRINSSKHIIQHIVEYSKILRQSLRADILKIKTKQKGACKPGRPWEPMQNLSVVLLCMLPTHESSLTMSVNKKKNVNKM